MPYYTRLQARTEFLKEVSTRKELYTNDLSFWPAIRRFEPDFLQNIEQFFACNYHDVFVRTRDDRIFAMGKNKCGSLGLGLSGEIEVTEPREVVEFRAKRVLQMLCIKDINFHIHLAVTEQGRLYSWGSNSYGMLGLNKPDPRFIATRPLFVMDKVQFVRSGVIHLAALDVNGCVWHWGACLHDSRSKIENHCKPIKLSSLQQVVDLECSVDVTVALTVSHEVFFWFTSGQYQVKPTRLHFSFPYSVVSLAAFYHSSFLMLTSTGQVLHCNYRGNQSRKVDHRPSAITCNLMKLPEPIACIISTDSHRSLTLLRTRTNRFLAVSETISHLPLVKPSSLTAPGDVIALYGHFQTPNLVSIGPTARENLDDLFNNPRTADLHLHNLNLYVHQYTLGQKQPYFGNLRNFAKIKKLVMRWTFFSYVHYLYHGQLVDGNELAFSLFILAFLVKDVKLLCSIVNHISLEMAHLYLLHREQLLDYLECHLSRAINHNRTPLNSMLTTRAHTQLDTSLKARIVRWMIQRAIELRDKPRVNPKRIFETPLPPGSMQAYNNNHNDLSSGASRFNSQLSFTVSSESSLSLNSSIIDSDLDDDSSGGDLFDYFDGPGELHSDSDSSSSLAFNNAFEEIYGDETSDDSSSSDQDYNGNCIIT